MIVWPFAVLISLFLSVIVIAFGGGSLCRLGQKQVDLDEVRNLLTDSAYHSVYQHYQLLSSLATSKEFGQSRIVFLLRTSLYPLASFSHLS